MVSFVILKTSSCPFLKLRICFMVSFVILKTPSCPFLKLRICFMISFVILKTLSCPFLKLCICFMVSFVILKTISSPFFANMYIINLRLLVFYNVFKIIFFKHILITPLVYLISLPSDNHVVLILTRPSSLLYRKI